MLLTVAILVSPQPTFSAGPGQNALDCKSHENKLTGSILQPQLADSWTDKEWKTEFQKMRNVCIDTLVLQWTADSKQHTTAYPSSLPGYSQNTTHDIVNKILSWADKYHIKVYLGLNTNDEWWSQYTYNRTWFLDQMQTGNKLMDDLWSRYGNHPSLKGWYVTFEPWNLATENNTEKNLTDGLALVAKHAHEVTNLPVMLAPFFNASTGQGPNEWKQMWAQILKNAPIDILAPQDGIGAGHAKKEELAPWFSATKEAIETGRPSTRLWADTETYTIKDWQTMPVNQILDDMDAVAPYVTKDLSFSFNHYLSPLQVNPMYYFIYRHYVNTGQRDLMSPTIPADLMAKSTGAFNVSLSWKASQDNFGVVGYKIYRNGVQVGITYNGSTSFEDTQLSPSTKYTYQVAAYDAAGNESPLSDVVTVTTPQKVVYSTNLALGRPYVSSMPASSSYTDTNGMELTDGKHGTTNFSDPAWQGRNTSDTYSFTVDLGSVQTIKEVNTSWLQVTSAAIYLPTQVTYSVSKDGSTFTSVAGIQQPAASDNDQVKSYIATDLNGIEGRYVRVNVSSSAWSFIDEIEVRQ